jgi:hypothetical protein
MGAPFRWLCVAALTAGLVNACAASGNPPTVTPSTATPPVAPSASSAPAVSSSATATAFSSADLPYSFRLPVGWVANAPTDGEDSYGSADGRITLTVGTGQPEPGQTVEDRVRINRELEFSACETDPTQDRPVTVGGEPGILWRFSCGGVTGIAANTIHDGTGYRLTLKSGEADAHKLEALMEAVLVSYSFLQ